MFFFVRWKETRGNPCKAQGKHVKLHTDSNSSSGSKTRAGAVRQNCATVPPDIQYPSSRIRTSDLRTALLAITAFYFTQPPEILKAFLISSLWIRSQLGMHAARDAYIITISIIIIIILAFTSTMFCRCMHVSFDSVTCSDCGQAVKSLRTRLTPSLIKFCLVILHGRQRDTAHLNPITSNQIFVCFFSCLGLLVF